jgi:DNA-binding NtrC family response regulator
MTLSRASREFEKRYIESALEAAKGKVSVAALTLGVFRTNLYRKMRDHGIPIPEASRRRPKRPTA